VAGGWNNQYIQHYPMAFGRQIPLEGYTTGFSAGYNWKQFSILCKLSNIANV
jgi:iron complex outermembrane receptor protein